MTTDLRPHDTTIGLRGLRLHYRAWGSPENPPLVMLHGLTSHARSWDHIAPAFAERYYIIALDQRGHGDSEHPASPAYRSEDYVADLAALVDALGFERFVLMGLSMGAHNGLAYTADHPERVTRLIPIDIGPAPRLGGPERAATPPPPRVWDSREAAWEHGRTTNTRADPALLHQRWMANLRELPDGRVELKYDVAAPREWQPADLWGRIGAITVPTLIVRGAESQVLTPEVAQRMTAAMPNARLVEIEGAGHPVPLDRPEPFVAAVRSFLEESS